MIRRLLWLFPAWIFVQCNEAPRTHTWFAMDTRMAVTLYGDKGRLSDDVVFSHIEVETARLESLFTDYSTRSGLARLRGEPGDTLVVDPQIFGVLATALEMARASQGAFDITLHDLKNLWGLDGERTGNVPTRRELDSVLHGNPTYGLAEEAVPTPPLDLLPGNRVILRRQDTPLDLGGIAKGYIVDQIHALLDSLGSPNHIVQAGGDIRVGGHKETHPWKVGIRHPREPDSLAGTIRSRDPFAVSTAGDYERYFIRDGVRYHHIFNPRTGIPVHEVISVTVVAPTSLAADAIDDALFVLGPKRGFDLAREFSVEAVWFLKTARGLCAIRTKGMPTRHIFETVLPCPTE